MCCVINDDAIDIDQYLREELTPKKDGVDIMCWKINYSKYSVLSKIARDILAILSWL
jgi:hypothetical protein